MQDFKGKVVLVTGAGGGIGRAAVRAFAARVPAGFVDDAALISNLSVLDGCAAR
jgi:NAD(P)-dependent dehydrogenase (short-subunit alcohol dehydrogenase family)